MDITQAALVPQTRHVKAPAGPEAFEHRNVRQGEFWRTIPKYREIDEATFLDHIWQGQNSIKSADELLETVKDMVEPSFYDDVREGFRRAPMSVRVSPYMIASVDWTRPYSDPIRTQFLPVASKLRPDHPRLTLDSLHELEDSPVPGLTHRYVDKALFLPLNTCPVYCRFCTRSYAIGGDTDVVEKVSLARTPKQWQDAFAYIASRPELEDIVISGGDTYQLAPKNVTAIGEALLAIPHVRRLRFATKGPAVMPMKILTDPAWTDAVARIVDKGRKLGKEVVIHTHFNSPNEISWITERAMNLLFERGDDAAARAPLELDQRAPVLRLHARPRQRRRGSAHDGADFDRHRKVRARIDGRFQHAALHLRCPGRRRQARRA